MFDYHVTEISTLMDFGGVSPEMSTPDCHDFHHSVHDLFSSLHASYGIVVSIIKSQRGQLLL